MRFRIEFGLEIRLVAAAHAGAVGATALRHEAIDHAVECHAIVKAFIGKLGNPLDMARSQIGAQLYHDILALSVSGIEGESQRIGHQ